MDRRLVEKLFRQHWQRLMATAVSLLYDEEAAKDAVGNVFARLLNADIAPQGDDDELGHYLLAAVRNECLKAHRNTTSRQRIEQLYVSEADLQDNADADEECLRQLYDFAKAHFSEQDLDLFRLRFMQGEDYKTICQQLGVSRITIWKRLRDIVKTIKNEFKLYQ